MRRPGDDLPVGRLSEAQVDELARLPLSYASVGATATAAVPPPGTAAVHRVRVLSPDIDLVTAGRRLMTWQMHLRAGLRVAASSPAVEPGVTVLLGLGVGPIRVSAPCRVVYVIEDDDRCGFAYGTLAGHPESGEERFVLRRRPDGRIELTIDAVSRPATAVARLGGPATRWVQARVTDRYLRALDV